MSHPLHLTPPQQTRSRRTLERIVDASLAILEEDGPDALTVQAIVGRARSSVGSFYARFQGKDDLLVYLGERVWVDAARRWDDALATRDWASLDLQAVAEGCVRLLWETARNRAGTLRALDRVPGGVDDAYVAFRNHLIAGMGELLLDHRPEILHRDPELAVSLGLQAVLGVVEYIGPDVGDPERVLHEASTLLLGYLAPATTFPHAPDGQVDFFDIWG
jgi:AcrR family transcriptional regulator